VAEDNDYSLVTVVLFKRVVDEFKAAARSRGYQVGTEAAFVWHPTSTHSPSGAVVLASAVCTRAHGRHVMHP